MAISFLNTENSPDNSPVEGQIIVQSAATSSEVRLAIAALDEYRSLLERYPTRQTVLALCATAPVLQLTHQRCYEHLTEDSIARLIYELAGRAD